MSTDIADWMTAKTFHPRLTITTGATDAVLAAVRQGLERVGYKAQEATPARIRLRHHDWFAIVSGKWERTEVVLSAGDGSVLVEVTKGAANRTGRKKGQQALNAAAAMLRQQGIELTVGPWHKAP
jgi:hypothetical protein